ncbi:MAG TPA: SLBB domain-containing protein [Candidatus Syntrophosphaera sp.]|nr:SLBB domain-containing protein [Candidatus Syntrophosphaera sp.]
MKTKLLIALLLLGVTLLSAQLEMLNPAQTYISVSVTGYVKNPGVYKMTPMDRLSDALEKARKPLTEQVLPVQTMEEPKVPTSRFPLESGEPEEPDYDALQGLRRVKVSRGGSDSYYDLQKFRLTGDASQNPLLRDGDVITVSAQQSTVSLTGMVYLPGEYEFVPGDKLSDILSLAQGFTPQADLGKIVIYRYRDNLVDFDNLAIDLNSTDASQVALQAFDRVVVPQDLEKRRSWKITVDGNVKAPGEYLVGESTTLYDVLLMCGGPSSRGDLSRAVYLNGSYSLRADPDFERLKSLYYSQMTVMEYQYMRNRLRQVQGRYSVDVARLWETQGKEGNVTLRDGDYLFVPELLQMVEVSGQVVNPGLVPWVRGKDYSYYIQQAGGYTNNHRVFGTRIISADSGNWVKPSRKQALEPGDVIFVSEKNERQFWTDFKDSVAVAASVLTIFVSVRAIIAK